MTTLAQLADRAQNAIGDPTAAIWSQAKIEEWVLDGIRAYSRDFPKTHLPYNLSTTINDQKYNLPADFLEIVTVEYPIGNTPPTYLQHAHSQSADFWVNGSQRYDIIHHRDTDTPDELWISDIPTASGQTIAIHYNARHNTSLAAGDTITIPPHHEDLIILMVVITAWQERLSAAVASSTTSPLKISEISDALSDTQQRLIVAIQNAKTSLTPSQTNKWAMDPFDPIY